MGWKKKLGASAGTLVAMFLVAEVGLRVFTPAPAPPDPKWTPYVNDPTGERNAVARRSKIPNLGYDLTPGSRTEMILPRGDDEPTVVAYEINGLGIRDHEYAYHKPDGVFRICVIGDSFTYGLGVNIDDTYPKAMERAFAELAPGKKIEVLNCGVFNYNTREEVLFLFGHVVELQPDLVLLGFVVNDVLTKNVVEWKVDSQGVKRRYVSKESTAYSPKLGFLERYALMRRPGVVPRDQPFPPTFVQGLVYDLRSGSRVLDLFATRLYDTLNYQQLIESKQAQFEDGSDGWGEVRKYLPKAAKRLRELGIDFQVTWIPIPKYLSEDWVFAAQHEKLRRLCEEELRVPFHTIWRTLLGYPIPKLEAHPHDFHTSPFANDLLGRKLAELILPTIGRAHLLPQPPPESTASASPGGDG